jgi:Zn-dependent peptidase ImmA (M78 family)
VKDLITKAKNRANEVRNSLGLGDEPISNIFRLLENRGIYLFKRPLKGNASAMFMKTKDAHLVIINSNKTLGHQIFSSAHELSHFLYDTHIMGGICVVDKYNQDLEIEKLADLFATNLLMPEDGILKHLFERTNNGKRNIRYTDIIYLQQYFNVSWSAMLNRVYNLGQLSKFDYEDYKQNIKIKKEASILGFTTELYEKDQSIVNSQLYIEKAMYAYNNDEISERKLEEILGDINTSIDELVLDGETSVLFEEEDYA